METAPERFQRLLEENNLTVTQTPLNVRTITDGGIVIDIPQLAVNFTKPEVKKDEPIRAETPTKTTE